MVTRVALIAKLENAMPAQLVDAYTNSFSLR